MLKTPNQLLQLIAPLILAAGLPLAATAQDAQSRTFSLPATCTAYLTAQMKSCSVSHHFTCSDDPEGYQRRVDFDEAGMTYLGTIDAETQWIASFQPIGGYNETLAPNPGDPASFTDLITTGIDTYDFRVDSPEIGQQHFIGQDRLTGNKIVIDGIELEETEFSIRSMDGAGTEMWRSAGNEYINRDWRMFLSGKSTIKTPTETWEDDDAPVEFIFPGEPGFLSISPKHGCGAVLSQAPLLPEYEVTEHDQL